MKMNKLLLIPVLAAIAELIKKLYGIEIDNQYIDVAAQVIIWGIATVGIFMHPKKQNTEENTLTAEEKLYH